MVLRVVCFSSSALRFFPSLCSTVQRGSFVLRLVFLSDAAQLLVAFEATCFLPAGEKCFFQRPSGKEPFQKTQDTSPCIHVLPEPISGEKIGLALFG